MPSLLLHPLDFLGCDDIEELAFFPAMDLASEKKIKLVGEVLDIYLEHFTVVPLQEHVRTFTKEKELLSSKPKFRAVGNEPTTKIIS